MATSTGPSGSTFQFPVFYNYPPYFTLQPVKETREKQLSLWSALIKAYCAHSKVYVVNTSEEFPLFVNSIIGRRLSQEAQVVVLDELVSQGSAEWLDKTKRECLVLWRKVEDWAAVIQNFAGMFGLKDSITTVDDLIRGDDVRGTELYGIDRRLLVRVLKYMEDQGKVRLFTGASQDEEGVKFL